MPKSEIPDPRKGFSERLNQALTAIGIPERGRAERIRERLPGTISPIAIRKWLVGEGYPDMERLAMMAKMARVSIDWLITGTTSSEREIALGKQEMIKASERVIQLSTCDFLDQKTKADLKLVGTELLKRL